METLTNTFKDNDIRIVIEDDMPWFHGSDVCRALGYSNPSARLSTLEQDEQSKFEVEITRGAAPAYNKQVTFANEYGVYRLVFTSQLDRAKEFKRWLAHEVLPELRQTGSVSIADSDLPTKFTISMNGKEIRHWLTEDQVYARQEDIIEASPYYQMPTVHIIAPDWITTADELGVNLDRDEDSQDTWLDHDALHQLFWRSTKPDVRSFFAVYSKALIRNSAKRWQNAKLSSAPAAYSNGSVSSTDTPAVSEDEGITIGLDELQQELDLLYEDLLGELAGAAYQKWSAGELRSEIHDNLVDGNLNNYERLYDQMNRQHGIDPRSRSGSGLQAMSQEELVLAVREAEKLMA